jgi:predicted small lipoprotein YifL
MPRHKIIALSIIVLLLAAACGQKGPLYIPTTEKSAVQTAEERAEEPQEQEESKKDEKNP